VLLSTSKGGGQRGGNFSSIIFVLGQITIVLYVICQDYYYFTNPVFKQAYERGEKLIEIVQTDVKQECEFIYIPPSIRYFDKHLSKFLKYKDFENIYRVVACIGNKYMNQYLENEVFMPRESSRFTSSFSEVSQNVATSRALVPLGYTEEMETSNALVTVEVKNQIVALNNELQPIIGRLENTMNSLIIYDGERMDVPKTKQNFDRYIQMSDEELFHLLYPQKELISKKNPETDSPFYKNLEFVKDTFSLLFDTISMVKEETPNVAAIDIVKQYIWMFKDYCIKKSRELKDIQTKTEREIEDFVKEANRTVLNIVDFLKILPWLVGINTTALLIILNFLHNLFQRTNNIRLRLTEGVRPGQLAITSGQLAITSGQLAIKNGERGGKSKRNKHKSKSRNKSRKNKTKKIHGRNKKHAKHRK
jgi:hypothetical protein